MRVPSHTMSRPSHIVCPACGSGELRPRGPEPARCDFCGFSVEDAISRTLEQIAALPDALGTHPCECGHPEMRLLPDGVFHCPSCSSEILPVEAASGLENARVELASARGRGVAAPGPGTRPRRQEARGDKKQGEGAREGSKHQGGIRS